MRRATALPHGDEVDELLELALDLSGRLPRFAVLCVAVARGRLELLGGPRCERSPTVESARYLKQAFDLVGSVVAWTVTLRLARETTTRSRTSAFVHVWPARC